MYQGSFSAERAYITVLFMVSGLACRARWVDRILMFRVCRCFGFKV